MQTLVDTAKKYEVTEIEECKVIKLSNNLLKLELNWHKFWFKLRPGLLVERALVELNKEYKIISVVKRHSLITFIYIIFVEPVDK